MSERATPGVPLYDGFDDYDQFVNWERRLAYELPFIEAQLEAIGAHRVLDVACGTGQHAIALARRGYQVLGADLSTPMIERARANAAAWAARRADGVSASERGPGEATFLVAGFGELARTGVKLDVDALLCLGSSLPHVRTEADLDDTLVDWRVALRPGGLLLVQNRNMDAVLARRDRWMPVQQRSVDGREWIFVRFYDFDEDGLTFNVVRLTRDLGALWEQRVDATQLYPWRRKQLVAALERVGFVGIECYGDMAGGVFDEMSSGNLVLTARKN
jgi:glycine/sarcosine N-methyltransferase